MLKVNAAEFVTMVSNLERTIAEADARSKKGLRLVEGRGVPIMESATPLTQEEAAEFIAMLDATIQHCQALNLVNTSKLALLHKQHYMTDIARWSDVRNDAHGILLSLYSESDSEIFLQLDSSRVQLFSVDEDKKHFGNVVATAFPSAALDIHEGGNCLALERWPAAVFHCMRVLEIGLNALSNKFGITSINWHNVIEECEAKIRKIDSNWGADWKDQQKFYSEAARHFMFVKDALRNHIMHVRDVFDEGKALSVWQHTKEFMQQISKRLHE